MSKLSTEQDIISYINQNPVAVLSTVNKHNLPHGAAVYVCHTTVDQLYFITKTNTQKFNNILENSKVSITIVDASDNTTLQASGHAKLLTDAPTIELIMSKFAKIYANSPDWLPPIAKIRAGAYHIVRIKLSTARLAKFINKKPGSDTIFQTLNF